MTPGVKFLLVDVPFLRILSFFSGTSCEVCNGRFTFSLGKQGYQCRDCKMKCHKECHVRANSYCSNTTVYDIELYVTGTLSPILLLTYI